MKSEKGITLTSLVLYIMLVLIVLGILATITASFQSNLKEVNKEGTKNSEIDKFNIYFLKDVKKQGNKVASISENKDEITFSLENESILPNEYQQVEYIESTGTQYIDTGVIWDGNNQKISGKVSITARTSSGGSSGGMALSPLIKEGGYYFGLAIRNSDQYPNGRFLNGAKYVDFDFDAQIDTIYNYIIDGNMAYINGSKVATTNSASKSKTNMYEFARNTDGATTIYQYKKLYNLTIYQNNELVRDFIPCYRKSDNVIGLYDLVTNTFYTNQGTGIFLKGADINKNLGNKYTFKDEAIYLNDNIKIAESIENCTFTDRLENGKTVISVTIKARDAEERNIEYVLSNEEYSSANEDENNYIDNNYTEIEYIESTGTQYIKTGIDSNSNLDVYLEFQITSDPSTFTRIFGSRENWQKNAFSIQKLADKKLRIDYGSQNYTDVDVISTNMRYIWRQEQNVLYINNTKVTEFSSTQFNGPELYLFNSNLKDSEIVEQRFNSESFTGRVFRLKISEENQTLLDLIPVIDSNNTVCLYDKVSEKFYYNQGTGDFIAGPKK